MIERESVNEPFETLRYAHQAVNPLALKFETALNAAPKRLGKFGDIAYAFARAPRSLPGRNWTAMNLKELASNLGLSQTTVSRALNGYPEVNESTRTRVAEAAARLGYRANASARRLATGRAGAFGMVLRAQDYGPHTTEFLGGLAARLAHDEIDI